MRREKERWWWWGKPLSDRRGTHSTVYSSSCRVNHKKKTWLTHLRHFWKKRGAFPAYIVVQAQLCCQGETPNKRWCCLDLRVLLLLLQIVKILMLCGRATDRISCFWECFFHLYKRNQICCASTAEKVKKKKSSGNEKNRSGCSQPDIARCYTFDTALW